MAVTKRYADHLLDDNTSQSSEKRPRLEPSISIDLELASSQANTSTASNTPDPRSQYSSNADLNTGFAPSVTTAASTKRPKNLLCTYEGCGKAFDRPARLEIHLRSHTNERPFICTEEGCNKTFLRNEHLKAHIKSKHNDERNYTCTYVVSTDENGVEVQCGKSFHTGQRLRRHVAAHEEKEQTKCQECGQVFRKLETLQRHIKSVHLNEDAYRCQHVDEADLMQEECGQTFATVGQLKAHEAREHGAQRYACSMCQQDGPDAIGFATYTELQDHIKLVHPPTCQQCGSICASARDLRAHMEIVHSTLLSRQRFECEHPGCGRKFTKRGNLQVHIQSVHAKIKAFICGETDLSKSKKVEGWSGVGCSEKFGSKAALESHIRTQHLGIAAHTNSSTSFQNLDGYAEAASLITGHDYDVQRPFACYEETCDFRFRREHDMAIHLELHHGWQIDDINDIMMEKAGFEDQQFWADDMLEQEDVADRLSKALSNNDLSLTNNGGIMAIDSTNMLIDPVLTSV